MPQSNWNANLWRAASSETRKRILASYMKYRKEGLRAELAFYKAKADEHSRWV